MSYRSEPMQKEDHREAILQLWAENMSDSHIADVLPQRYRWLYGSNPEGETQTWVVVHVESGDVVGCGSYISRRMHMGDDSVDGGILADFAVTQKHRVAGPAISVQRALARGSVASGHAFLVGYPNDKAIPIFNRLRYAVIGKSREWVKPIRSEYKVREYVKQPLAAKLAARLVDAGYRAYDWAGFLRHPRRFRTEISKRADASFDELWDNNKPRYIVGEKTSEFLNWRYADFTTKDCRFFKLLSHAGELLGFVAYSVTDEGRVVVADMFCDFEKDADLLVFAFSERMRREGHQVIGFCYLGNRFFDDVLKAQHFLLRDRVRTLIAYVDKSAPEPLRKRVLDPEAWFMLDGELDI